MEKRKTMLSSQLKTNNLARLKLVVLIIIAQANAWAIDADFQTIFESAQKNSADLKISQAHLNEAVAESGIANSAFMPKVGIEARNEKFNSEIEDRNQKTANIYAEINLFNGFKDVNNRKSQKTNLKISKIQKEKFDLNFEWLAKAKYAKAYALQEQVSSYKKIIESNLRNLETVKRQKQSGRLSDADFLEFQLFDAKLKQDLVRLELDAATALADLKIFSGLTDIEKLTTKLFPKSVQLSNSEIKTLLNGDKSRLAESQLRVESLEALKSQVNGNFLPEVNLRATRGSMGFREAEYDPETVVSLSAKWELFSGLEDVNRRKQVIAKLSEAQIQYDNDKLSLQSHSEQLLKQINNIVERLKFEEENQKSVEKFLSTVESEYRRGVKSSSDLKSALDLILATSLNRADLRSDYFVSRFELQNLIGQTLQEK